jgi:hypothetical protein
MKIGRLHKMGEAIKLNKWYVGIEILKCPPTMVGIFRPYFFFICVKFKTLGEPYMIGGKKEEKIGGWKRWSSPIGIVFEIIRYK